MISCVIVCVAFIFILSLAIALVYDLTRVFRNVCTLYDLGGTIITLVIFVIALVIMFIALPSVIALFK